MKRAVVTIFISLVCLSFSDAFSFKKEQLKYATVSTAYAEKWGIVKAKLTKAGIDTSKFEIFIRVFKREGNLEVWARSNRKDTFKLVDRYEICSSSGSLGPKRKEGDGQVPEGFYHVSVFQPASMFYLALGVSYPNKADLVKSNKSCPGGNIMIHGNCVTIGCMPMTDDKIKEIYIMAVEAYSHGEQTIPIHIFPTKLNDAGMAFLKNSTSDQSSIDFWNNLKPGYAYFETKKLVPTVNVNDKGDYIFE